MFPRLIINLLDTAKAVDMPKAFRMAARWAAKSGIIKVASFDSYFSACLRTLELFLFLKINLHSIV